MQEAWSKSSLKAILEGCAWQWALQKLGGLETKPSPQSAAGSGFHAAIEWHEQCRIGGREVPSAKEMLAKGLSEATKIAQDIQDWERYGLNDLNMFSMVTNALDGWHKDIRPVLETYDPIMVEPYFKTDVGAGSEIHGYIDWFGKDNEGRFTVVDYKTSSSFSRWSGDMTGLGIEAAVYLAGAVHADVLPSDENVRMEWHVAKTKGSSEGRVVAGPEFTPDLLFFLAEKMDQANAMVSERKLDKNTNWNLCSERWCDFYHGCEVSGVLAPENVVL